MLEGQHQAVAQELDAACAEVVALRMCVDEQAAKAAADDGGAKYDAVVLDCAGGELAAAAAVFAWEMLSVDGVLLVVPRDDASVKVRV